MGRVHACRRGSGGARDAARALVHLDDRQRTGGDAVRLTRHGVDARSTVLHVGVDARPTPYQRSLVDD